MTDALASDPPAGDAAPAVVAPASAGGGTLVLRAEGLVKRYRRRTVVGGVSVEVRQGQCVGLLGPNGAGKTTTFHMIVGMVRPDAGDIFLGPPGETGVRLTRMPMHLRARRGLGYLAQEASVFAHLSVENNIRAVLDFQRGLSRADREARVEALVEEFGLE